MVVDEVLGSDEFELFDRNGHQATRSVAEGVEVAEDSVALGGPEGVADDPGVVPKEANVLRRQIRSKDFETIGVLLHEVFLLEQHLSVLVSKVIFGGFVR